MTKIQIDYDPPILHRRYIWGRKHHDHNHNSKIKFFYADQDFPSNYEYSQPPQTPLFYRGTRLYPISGTPTGSSSLKPSPRPVNQAPNEDQSDKPVQSSSDRNQKPHIVTIIRNGQKPYTFFKMLLSKNSGQSYDDLLQDISEAFGSAWKRKPIKKLLSEAGNEVKDISDLIKLGKFYVAIGEKEKILNSNEIKKIIEETFPGKELVNDQDNNNNKPKNRGKIDNPTNDDQHISYTYKPNHQNPNDKNGRQVKIPRNVLEKPQSERNKDNQLKKTQLPKQTNTNDNFPPGYPYNDSRKPGAFDMPLENLSSDPLPFKLRAQIFGLERLRAGLEERERARDAMAKKIDIENEKLKERKYHENSYPRRNLDSKYKNSPYLEILERPRNEWMYDKENLIPYGNQKDPRYYSLYNSKNPKSQRYKNSFLENDKNERMNPKTERIINWKPFKNSKSLPKKLPQFPSKNVKKKSQNPYNDDSMDDRRNHSWARIPPINFGFRNSQNERYRPPSVIKISPLPTVNEEDFESKPKDQEQNKNKGKTIPVEKKNTNKFDMSFEVDMEDETGKDRKKENEYEDQSQPSKEIQTNENEHLKNIPKNLDFTGKKHRLSLAGLRSQSFNGMNREKSHQKPSRTKKQSLIIQNTSSTRILPLLAKQLDGDDDFSKLYHIGNTIGTGNFAEVKVAKKDGTGKPFAVKIIDKSKLKDKEDLVEEEIRILQNCNHPNIVKLEEQFETPDKVYMVQELVKDGDLFDAICENIKFPESQAAVMMRDLLQALFYIHSRGVAHRDIKPENLLCTLRNGIINLKLTDFGLAIEIKEPLFVICGTPTYVAPEILTDKGYGLEVDIWAAGVICYILLCGFPPFRSPDRNQTELFEFIKAGEFEYLKPYWNNISDESMDLINQMLIIDPSKRYTALDCLSHSWIITLGMSIKFTKPLKEIIDETKNDLRREEELLKSQSKGFRNS